MKKSTLLIASAALFSTASFAQNADPAIGLRLPTQKGSIMLGSNLLISELSFGSTHPDVSLGGTYNIGLAPNAAYFIKDNLAIGISINASFAGNSFGGQPYNSGYHSQTISAGVYARQYIGKAADKAGKMNRTRFFVEAGAGIGKGWAQFKVSDTVTNHGSFNSATFYVMPGVNYFFNKNVAFEGGLKLTHNTSSGEVVFPRNTIGVNLGLKVFMGKR